MQRDAATIARALELYDRHAFGSEEIRYLSLYRSLSAAGKAAVASYATALASSLLTGKREDQQPLSGYALDQRLKAEAIDAAQATINTLTDALAGLLNHYVALVESGDAGNWNAEDEDVVKRARAALRAVP